MDLLKTKALTIFIREYAKQNDLIYEDRNSGGELSYRLVSPKIKVDVKEDTDIKRVIEYKSSNVRGT